MSVQFVSRIICSLYKDIYSLESTGNVRKQELCLKFDTHITEKTQKSLHDLNPKGSLI